MRAALSAPQPPGDWQHPIGVQWPAAPQAEQTYTHAEVRRWLNELSAAAKSFGLEVVSTITGPNESVFGLRRIDPQPAADERVAEHMKLVRLYGDESYGCTRKVADAYAAVESSARALLADGREDMEVTEAMITAYLEANDAYWIATDEIPRPPGKWRTGTPREATRVSLTAALAAIQKGTP